MLVLRDFFRGRSFPCICRPFVWCRRWDSNPHEVALTGFFESDKDCAMVRDASLRGAFMSLFAFLCGIVRVRVRPDCHQNSHHHSSTEAQNYDPEVGYYTAVE